jgi:hypothetical protein
VWLDFTVYLTDISLLSRTELPTERESVITLIPQNRFENRYCDDNASISHKANCFLESPGVCGVCVSEVRFHNGGVNAFIVVQILTQLWKRS